MSVGGTWPRHFLVTPDGLNVVVSSQFVDLVEVFPVDQADGSLGEVASSVDVPGLQPTIVIPVNQ